MPFAKLSSAPICLYWAVIGLVLLPAVSCQSASPTPSISPSPTPGVTHASGSASPVTAVFILLIVVALLICLIIGLIAGFCIYLKLRSKRAQNPTNNLNNGYAQLSPYGVVAAPGMVPGQAVAMPFYANMQPSQH